MKSIVKMLLNLFKKKAEKKVEEVKKIVVPAPKQEDKPKGNKKKYYKPKAKSNSL